MTQSDTLDPAAPTPDPQLEKKAVWAWCLYDWANSAVPTVIGTFVFATYFTKAIAPDEVTGTGLWGNAMALAGLGVAVLAPVLGAIADGAGRRKPWIAFFTAACCVATAMLWFAAPSEEWIYWALIFTILSTWGFEFGTVFYNAMLADVAPRSHYGRVSGWGWGLGYAGGLASLVVCLIGFVQTETPWFGVSTENAENIRAVTLVVAVWFAVFSLPLLILAPDRPRGLSLGPAVRQGLATLVETIRQLKRYRLIARFLLARMIYADGIATLFAFGGIYAAGTFGMSFAEVIQFAIAMNVGSALGAAAFAFLDDRIGGKPVITLSLIALITFGSILLLIDSVTLFWIFGLGLSVFVGPVQAASRAMMARLAPPEKESEFFGLYALSGKATAFLGPLILGWVTVAFDSQRAGMATVVVFLLIGLALLAPLKLPTR
ncbi:MAG: MFS transporter [Alphaproteobacteria bacterium]|nr:MFS transporter [Alphaproteobacteria bacterium]